MNAHRPLIFTVAGCALLAGSAVNAQNLSDRIDHVMQQRTAAEANNTSKAHMLGVLLYTDISVQFNDTKARDAFKYLETVLGINIVARYNDDKTGTGLDPEAPITLNVTNQPGLTVLEMVLEQAAGGEPATWQLREGFVEVGTKERLNASAARQIRYYAIRDLLFEAPKFNNAPKLDLDSALNQGQGQGGGGSGGGGGGFGGGGGGGSGGGGGGGSGSIFSDTGENPEPIPEAERAQQIIDIITETVEPDAWEANGGDAASIRYYQGTLIIRAPDYIQRQIGGYPFAVRPVGAAASADAVSRYVMFTGGLSNVTLTGFRQSHAVGGAAGGSPSSGNSATTNSSDNSKSKDSRKDSSKDSSKSSSSNSQSSHDSSSSNSSNRSAQNKP